jgi:hypothetical protein
MQILTGSDQFRFYISKSETNASEHSSAAGPPVLVKRLGMIDGQAQDSLPSADQLRSNTT